MTPFFSLILPCYNVAQYLERCVHSILNQDFEDYEIILMDDGSTDQTPVICDTLAAKYACIRVIHKTNGGLFSARNAGLDVARGRFVWFVDSDDWIEEGALALLQQACCNSNVDVVKFDYYRIEHAVETVHCDVAPGLYQGDEIDILRRKAFCGAGQYCLSACTHVYRRALLEEYGLRFESERKVGSEDYLFNLQVLLHVHGLMMLCSPLYSYERREGSLTQTYKADLDQRYIVLKERIADYYRNQQMLDKYRMLIDRFFIWHLMIGTCVVQIYDAIRLGHSKEAARRAVRRLLCRREVKNAAKHGDKSGLPWKKRVLLLALRLRLEPLFYYVYAAKDE